MDFGKFRIYKHKTKNNYFEVWGFKLGMFASVHGFDIADNGIVTRLFDYNLCPVSDTEIKQAVKEYRAKIAMELQ